MRGINALLLSGMLLTQAQPGDRPPRVQERLLPPMRITLDTSAAVHCPMPVARPLRVPTMPVLRPDSAVDYRMPVVAGRCFNPLYRGPQPGVVRIRVPRLVPDTTR